MKQNKNIAKTNKSNRLLPIISPTAIKPLCGGRKIEAILVINSGKLVIIPSKIAPIAASEILVLSFKITHSFDRKIDKTITAMIRIK